MPTAATITRRDFLKEAAAGLTLALPLALDPSLLTPGDREMAEDLIMAAHADARAKADRLAEEKMQAVTQGLPLPPGMKLPF